MANPSELNLDLFNKADTARRIVNAPKLTNGNANKLRVDDRAVHDWYRFVLAFPPHLVAEYIERFGLTCQHTLLDPFCGTGTTLVESKLHGIPCIGIEAHPMSHFASQVKLNWEVDALGLWKHAHLVAEKALKALGEQGIEDEPVFNINQASQYKLRTLSPEQTELLLKDSISPLPLHKTLVLLDCLRELRDDVYNPPELLALAKALVFRISNLRFGPEVGVGKAKTDAPVINPWLQDIRSIVDDLLALRDLSPHPAQAILGDSRHIDQILSPNSVDAVFTSPPYPNEKDYTRTTRLETVLLGFVKNKSELQKLKRSLVRSNTRGVYKDDRDDQWISDHPVIRSIAEAIEKKRMELGKTSGFERQYARVTKLYFGGMYMHLKNLRQVLKPGARLAYVVGDQASYLRVLIRTGQILADIAQSLGYQLVSLHLFRTRMSTATREQLREEVVVLRWPE